MSRRSPLLQINRVNMRGIELRLDRLNYLISAYLFAIGVPIDDPPELIEPPEPEDAGTLGGSVTDRAFDAAAERIAAGRKIPVDKARELLMDELTKVY